MRIEGPADKTVLLPPGALARRHGRPHMGAVRSVGRPSDTHGRRSFLPDRAKCLPRAKLLAHASKCAAASVTSIVKAPVGLPSINAGQPPAPLAAVEMSERQQNPGVASAKKREPRGRV